MNRLILLLLPFAAACSSMSAPDISLPNFAAYLKPYIIDVKQGNMVTQEMVAQLKPGQSKDQVRFILGTPLVADIFHADRWDYVYRMQYGNAKSNPSEKVGTVEQRRFVVFFENNKLVRVGGDVAATDSASTAAASTEKPRAQVIDIPPRDSEKKEDKKPDEKKEDVATEAKPDTPAKPAAAN